MTSNVFSYIGKSIFWMVMGYAVPGFLQGVGNFLEVAFRPAVIFGFQIFCIIMVLANLTKLGSYLLQGLDDE